MWFLRLFKTVPDQRYFVDIYANCHGIKRPDIKIDYEHRRKPLTEPLPAWAGYVPFEDYSAKDAPEAPEGETKSAEAKPTEASFEDAPKA